jgi:hypothetical protein
VPITKQPRIFTKSVPNGNVKGKTCTINEVRRKRATLPIIPPSATKRRFLLIVLP